MLLPLKSQDTLLFDYLFASSCMFQVPQSPDGFPRSPGIHLFQLVEYSDCGGSFLVAVCLSSFLELLGLGGVVLVSGHLLFSLVM